MSKKAYMDSQTLQIPKTGTPSIKCHLTSKPTLTNALVVMEHPARFAVEAFVVLWPRTFLA